MFRNLVWVFCLMSTTLSVYNGPLAGGLPASLYPAGIDPRACPNFPNCASPFVALSKGPPAVPAAPQQAFFQPQQQQQQQQQYAAAPQQFVPASPQYAYAQPAPQQYSPPEPQLPAHLQDALNRGEYIGDGDYRGEGLAESQPPGAPVAAPQYSPAAAAPQYSPAGASPQYSPAAASPQYSPAAAAPQYSPAAAAPQYGAAALQQFGQAAVPQYTQRTALQYSADQQYGGVAAAPQYSPAVGTAAAQYGAAGVAPLAVPGNIPAGLHPQACPNYPFCHQ